MHRVTFVCRVIVLTNIVLFKNLTILLPYIPVGLGVSVIMLSRTECCVKSYLSRKLDPEYLFCPFSLPPLRRKPTVRFTAFVYSRTPKLVCGTTNPIDIFGNDPLRRLDDSGTPDSLIVTLRPQSPEITNVPRIRRSSTRIFSPRLPSSTLYFSSAPRFSCFKVD